MRFPIDLHVETTREGDTVVASAFVGRHRLSFEFDGVVCITAPTYYREADEEAVDRAIEKFAARLNEVLAVDDPDW